MKVTVMEEISLEIPEEDLVKMAKQVYDYGAEHYFYENSWGSKEKFKQELINVTYNYVRENKEQCKIYYTNLEQKLKEIVQKTLEDKKEEFDNIPIPTDKLEKIHKIANVSNELSGVYGIYKMDASNWKSIIVKESDIDFTLKEQKYLSSLIKE